MFIYPIAILLIEDDGDRAFMEGLYLDYRRIMFAQARKVLGSSQDVEDVISDACLALSCKISLLKAMTRPVLCAYVVSTIRNTAINHAIKQQREKNHTVDLGDEWFAQMPDSAQITGGECFRDEAITRMECAIAKLSEREASILNMRYYQEMDDREIARLMGAKPETIRKAIYRARKRLLAIYEKGGRKA